MKPPGLEMRLSGNVVVMGVTKSSRATDLIWDAVEQAIAEGIDVRQFRSEAAEAWDYTLKQAARDAAKDWSKP